MKKAVSHTGCYTHTFMLWMHMATKLENNEENT